MSETVSPGHDRRYAIDASKLQRELGWIAETFDIVASVKRLSGYLDNPDRSNVQSGAYRAWTQNSMVRQLSTFQPERWL
jgi:dTDP-glucose 4,6-dehydratase